MPAKIYRRLFQVGLIGSLFIVFLVYRDLLFPYITSKQLTFNIVMEVMLAVWLVFISVYPAYRPKKNYITIGLASYFLAILASCLVSVNFNLSFWGNAERMLGLFHIAHFFIFYLILITVFRSWREWQALLLSSVLVATIISFIGLTSGETYATIGNTAYVSGYLIFNIFFTIILFFRSESTGWRWLLSLPLILMLAEFWSCHTSGAIIGLFVSFLLALLLLGIFYENKTVRRYFLGSLLAILIFIALIFSQREASWFQNSFLKNLTSQKATFQTRLISWKSAAKDFKNHPLLGTGYGNYAITFDKYFDSKFYNYSKSETYFDRAHNNLIDIASTTGLVGLVTYLSIFFAALYYLWQEFKDGGHEVCFNGKGRFNLEILIIISLLAAYFIQNLAVFDSYVTYMGLMIILGYIYWLSQADSEEEAGSDSAKHFLAISQKWEWSSLIVLLLVAYLFASQFNLKPWRMFQGVILNGYSQIMEGKYYNGINSYRQALSGTHLDHDGRVTLINLLSSNPEILKGLSDVEAKDAIDYILTLAKLNVAENPKDSLMQMQLAQTYDAAARYSYQDLKKFNEYSQLSLETIDKSIEASPNRATIYFIKAQFLLFRGEKEKAIQAMNYAINLNPEYPEGYCRLTQFYVFLNDTEKMSEPLRKCVDLGGLADVNSIPLLVKMLNFYATSGEYEQALLVGQHLVAIYPTDGQIWLNLAKLYFITGDSNMAQAAVSRAIAIDKKMANDWADFLQAVKKLPAAAGSAPAINK